MRLVVLAWLGEHEGAGEEDERGGAAPDAEEDVEVLGDDSSRLGEVLGVQEEEEVEAVSFPCSACRGGAQRLGSDGSFRRRPWRRGGGRRERRRGKNGGGERGLGFGGERGAGYIGRRASSVSSRRRRCPLRLCTERGGR
jgi:hypothetical protein